MGVRTPAKTTTARPRPRPAGAGKAGAGVAAGNTTSDGWHGWDDYAPFYDWENARTLGRRDLPFWLRMTRAVRGPVLELGCGTGRVTFPLAHDGVHVVGVDRSSEMLARARRRARRQRRGSPPELTRTDIRALPFGDGTFPMVMAPYGILQSLLSERDLKATLAEVARVVRPDGIFALELVADLPSWGEYGKRVSMRGRRSPGGAHVTLVEAVRQDRRRGLTIFDQEFIERRGRHTRRHAFALTFRTLSVPQMCRRLTSAGLTIEAVLGDYDGGPWHPAADAWIVIARRPRAAASGPDRTRHGAARAGGARRARADKL